MNEKIARKEVIAFVLIVVAMLGSLVYGYFLLKENQKPAPLNCWEQYEDQGEDVAIQMCEVHPVE